MWPIKNFEKYFMAHQYVPKIFHDPSKTLHPINAGLIRGGLDLNSKGLSKLAINFIKKV